MTCMGEQKLLSDARSVLQLLSSPRALEVPCLDVSTGVKTFKADRANSIRVLNLSVMFSLLLFLFKSLGNGQVLHCTANSLNLRQRKSHLY